MLLLVCSKLPLLMSSSSSRSAVAQPRLRRSSLALNQLDNINILPQGQQTQPTSSSQISNMPHVTTTYLRDAAVEPSTLFSYESAVKDFLTWCSIHSIHADTVDDMDAALSDYIESLYVTQSGGKDKANKTLAGIIRRVPQWKLMLPLSR